jgi:hypothetical protein
MKIIPATYALNCCYRDVVEGAANHSAAEEIGKIARLTKVYHPPVNCRLVVLAYNRFMVSS